MAASFLVSIQRSSSPASFLGILPLLVGLLVSTGAFALGDLELDVARAGFEGRSHFILQDHITSRFPSFDNSDPTTASEVQIRAYAWRQLNYAQAIMSLDNQSLLAVANDSVTSACTYLDRCANSQFLPAAGQFHWVAPNLFRIYEMFRPGGTAPNAGCLTPANVAAIRAQAWRLVDARANFEATETTTTRACKTWRILDSENHHLMSNTAIWWACKILIDGGLGASVCDEGGTVAQYYAAYTNYFREYLIERARRGQFIEIDSHGYGKHTLQNFYNMLDFAEDPIVRMRAGKLLDLYWSIWASNQIDGVNGGSKARCYQHVPGHLQGDQDFGYPMAWFYANVGQGPGGNSNFKEAPMVVAITSRYRIPRVILDIILDVPGRGIYESRQRAMGLALPGYDNPPDYRMPTDFGGILRYTYGTPDFMMGSSLMAPRPESDWTAISSQNRWNGVIFRGHNHARIFPQGKSTEAGHSYNRTLNSHWTTQRKGTMIAQKLVDSRNTGRMRVWFPGAGSNMTTTSFPDASGWIFATAPHAYAAVRPAAGTFNWVDPDPEWERNAPDGSWYQSAGAAHDFHPIIIEAVRKSAYPSLEAFKDDIKDNPFSHNPATRFLDYTSTYGDRFEFYGDESGLPLINGVPDDLAPPKTYDTPFVQAPWESSVISVAKGNRSLIIDFDDLSTVGPTTVTAPFDGYLYVNRLAEGVIGDGHSFATGFARVQQAIDAWTPSVQGIRVAQGAYSGSFHIDQNGIRIEGGYNAQSAQRDPRAYPTILLSDGGYHVARVSGATGWLLDGVTLQGGAAMGTADADGRGGGLSVEAGAGTVRGAVFAANTAKGGGAACIDGAGDVAFEQCLFSGNSATEGGAVQLLGAAQARFEDCLFTSNTMASRGGAVQIKSSAAQARFERCGFFHNGGNPAATTYGGVAEVTSGSLVFKSSVFAYNRAGRGPVVSAQGTALDMMHCTAVGNFTSLSAQDPQGILRLIPPSGSTYNIINSIFESNTGAYAMRNWGAGGLLVRNNLFQPSTAGSVYDTTLDVAALNNQAWAQGNLAGPANLRALGGSKRSGIWTTVTLSAPVYGYATLEDAAASHAPGSLAGAMLAVRGDLSAACLPIVSNTAKAITVWGAAQAGPGDAYIIAEYSPQRPSPAIDAASLEPAPLMPASDYLGASRQYPVGKPDIGAYELALPENTSAQGHWSIYE